MPTIQPGSGVDPAALAASIAERRAGASSETLATEHVAGVNAADAAKLKAESAGQQFEAMFLRQMLEEFMPKDSQTNFGGGTAGTVWRSMLADSMATTMSKSGSMGLAHLIVAHDVKTKEPE